VVVRTGVVTPEAVLLDLPTAGVATRAFARLIDLVIQVVVGLVLGLVLAFVGGGLSLTLVILVVVVFTLLVWPIGLEVLWRGRSVGKAVFGLWVISADGSPVQPRQSVVRGLLALIDIYFSLGFVALLSAMFSPAGQRLGDMAASTVVVRHRHRHNAENPVVFYPPAGYETYVAGLDVTAMTSEEFSLVREFLLRVGQMSPRARSTEALALAEALRQRIHHDLPAAVDPELWLICVAAAFQWQEGGLLREVARGVAPVVSPQPQLGRRGGR
jgi:uncharacterized RDD family membrane protein YckC